MFKKNNGAVNTDATVNNEPTRDNRSGEESATDSGDDDETNIGALHNAARSISVAILRVARMARLDLQRPTTRLASYAKHMGSIS